MDGNSRLIIAFFILFIRNGLSQRHGSFGYQPTSGSSSYNSQGFGASPGGSQYYNTQIGSESGFGGSKAEDNARKISSPGNGNNQWGSGYGGSATGHQTGSFGSNQNGNYDSKNQGGSGWNFGNQNGGLNPVAQNGNGQNKDENKRKTNSNSGRPGGSGGSSDFTFNFQSEDSKNSEYGGSSSGFDSRRPQGSSSGGNSNSNSGSRRPQGSGNGNSNWNSGNQNGDHKTDGFGFSSSKEENQGRPTSGFGDSSRRPQGSGSSGSKNPPGSSSSGGSNWGSGTNSNSKRPQGGSSSGGSSDWGFGSDSDSKRPEESIGGSFNFGSSSNSDSRRPQGSSSSGNSNWGSSSSSGSKKPQGSSSSGTSDWGFGSDSGSQRPQESSSDSNPNWGSSSSSGSRKPQGSSSSGTSDWGFGGGSFNSGSDSTSDSRKPQGSSSSGSSGSNSNSKKPQSGNTGSGSKKPEDNRQKPNSGQRPSSNTGEQPNKQSGRPGNGNTQPDKAGGNGKGTENQNGTANPNKPKPVEVDWTNLERENKQGTSLTFDLSELWHPNDKKDPAWRSIWTRVRFRRDTTADKTENSSLSCHCTEYSACAPEKRVDIMKFLKHNNPDIRVRMLECASMKKICCMTTKKDESDTRPACGKRVSKLAEHDIRNDGAANYGDYPWVLRLVAVGDAGEETLCSASLIHNSIALTTASCALLLTGKNVRVRSGEWNVVGGNDKNKMEETTVGKVYLHPDFDVVSYEKDLALLFLDAPLHYNRGANTICLPTHHDAWDASKCVVVGWTKNGSGLKSAVLKEVELEIVAQGKCRSRDGLKNGLSDLEDPGYLCAHTRKDDPYLGDPGASILCPLYNTDSVLQVGFVSNSAPGKRDRKTYTFTDILDSLDWVYRMEGIYAFVTAEDAAD